MEERNHILSVLKETLFALKKRDTAKIKILSNEIIHASSIQQDPDIISIAVIIYSLSKLIERQNYQDYKNWPRFYANYVNGIEDIIKSLQKSDLQGFRRSIENIRQTIEKLTGQLKIYIIEVFRKAKINKASRIYEHGISMEQTAKILGVSVWELAEYAGQTGIADVNFAVTMPIKERIKIAEEVFKK